MKPGAVGRLSPLPQKRKAACGGSSAPPEQLPLAGGGDPGVQPHVSQMGSETGSEGVTVSRAAGGRGAPPPTAAHPAELRARQSWPCQPPPHPPRGSAGVVGCCGERLGSRGVCLRQPVCYLQRPLRESRVLPYTPTRPVSLIAGSGTFSAGQVPGQGQQGAPGRSSAVPLGDNAPVTS